MGLAHDLACLLTVSDPQLRRDLIEQRLEAEPPPEPEPEPYDWAAAGAFVADWNRRALDKARPAIERHLEKAAAIRQRRHGELNDYVGIVLLAGRANTRILLVPPG